MEPTDRYVLLYKAAREHRQRGDEGVALGPRRGPGRGEMDSLPSSQGQAHPSVFADFYQNLPRTGLAPV